MVELTVRLCSALLVTFLIERQILVDVRILGLVKKVSGNGYRLEVLKMGSIQNREL